ncbi:uncharacterized protein I206_103435 [Kwoniella pini CBS 10737]|uniref:Chromo domain-containing protein n=1 Tax=Kwoniella pini CBS 10737 TaxID=1296096 RepID=A0A1B9I9N5_9TREE|nr:uncharacterized protein I206_01562 [Kwoniella pini CBS 10737]OCF52275.1 hypothetical protein I206_01562 [Kwoniella pini CBS 10737]
MPAVAAFSAPMGPWNQAISSMQIRNTPVLPNDMYWSSSPACEQNHPDYSNTYPCTTPSSTTSQKSKYEIGSTHPATLSTAPTGYGYRIIDRPKPKSSRSSSSLQSDDQKITHILGNITNLLLQQSQLINTNQEKLIITENEVQANFNELNEKVRSLTQDQLNSFTDLRNYLKEKVDQSTKRLDYMCKSGNLKRRIGNKNNGPTGKSKGKSNLMSSFRNDIDTTPSSEAIVEDLIRFDTPCPELEVQNFVNQFMDVTPQPVMDLDNFTNDAHHFARNPLPSLPEENMACSLDQTLVDKAVSRQLALLNGKHVLPEGEDAVGFIFRKRLKGNRCDNGFKIDMSFLDEISIAAHAHSGGDSSNLSSGVDSLPNTGNTNTPVPNTQHTYQTANIAKPWNPFPLNYIREPTALSIADHSSVVSTDDSILTSVKRGTSLVEDKLLLPGSPEPPVPRKRRRSGRVHASHKRKGKANVWPNYGINTVKTRMEEIICDTCGGRVHWACAGLNHGKSMREAPWSCPDCLTILMEAEEDEDGRLPSIPRAQQEKCLRPDCIFLTAKKIVRKNDDDNEFYLEKIIGRKRLHYNDNGGATYIYLIKWYDWEIYDSTWEPAKNIPDLERWETIFLQQFKHSPDVLTQRVWLLEECTPWFDYKGHYNTELLKSLNIEKRTWWDDKI